MLCFFRWILFIYIYMPPCACVATDLFVSIIRMNRLQMIIFVVCTAVIAGSCGNWLTLDKFVHSFFPVILTATRTSCPPFFYAHILAMCVPYSPFNILLTKGVYERNVRRQFYLQWKRAIQVLRADAHAQQLDKVFLHFLFLALHTH